MIEIIKIKSRSSSDRRIKSPEYMSVDHTNRVVLLSCSKPVESPIIELNKKSANGYLHLLKSNGYALSDKGMDHILLREVLFDEKDYE